MDRATRAKIDSLTYEIGTWGDGEARLTAEELAKRFQLDPLVVQRIMDSHGFGSSPREPEGTADPNRTTQVLDLNEVRRRLDEG
jgi:hypothetical protein